MGGKPQDRDAIRAWVEGNGDSDKAKEVHEALAMLPQRTADIQAAEARGFHRGKLAGEKAGRESALREFAAVIEHTQGILSGAIRDLASIMQCLNLPVLASATTKQACAVCARGPESRGAGSCPA